MGQNTNKRMKADKYDFYADKAMLDPDGIKFRLNGKWDISMGLVGRHNIYNALSAIALSWDFGVTLDDIKEALREFRVPNMRMEVKRLQYCNSDLMNI